MKKLIIHSKSTPAKPALGFGDMCYLHNNKTLIYASPCSCCPNPFRPSDGVKWRKAYGFMDYGKYKIQCVLHKEFGKCLIVNNGDKVKSRNKNPNHSGKKYLTGIYCHEANIGYKNPLWRGSRGCLTWNRDLWGGFISNFDLEEKGYIQIVKEYNYFTEKTWIDKLCQWLQLKKKNSGK